MAGTISGHRRLRGLLRGNIVQHRRQPAFDFLQAHAFAPGIVLDLVAIDFRYGEVLRFRVGRSKNRCTAAVGSIANDIRQRNAATLAASSS